MYFQLYRGDILSCDILSQLKEVDILSQDNLATRVHQNIKKFLEFYSNLIYVVSIYGSVSAGREFWPFRVIFFQKVERSCGQTVKDRFDFSIDSGQLYLVHSGDLNLALEFFLESHGGHHHHHQHHHHHFQKNAPKLDKIAVSPARTA